MAISSRQVTALHLRCGSAGNTDDRSDACVLADVLRSDGRRLACLHPDSPGTRGLKGVVRARKGLIGHRIAMADQLPADLLTTFPGAVGHSHPGPGLVPGHHRCWTDDNPYDPVAPGGAQRLPAGTG